MLVEAAATGAAGLAAMAYLDAKMLFSSDFHLIKSFGTAATKSPLLERQHKLTMYYILKDHAEKRPNHPAIVFEGYTWTSSMLFQAINRCAHWLTGDLGLKKGDVVALDFTNCADYCLLILAMEATGIVSSHINCNLTDESLSHCVKVSS